MKQVLHLLPARFFLLVILSPHHVLAYQSYTARIPNGPLMGSFGGQGVGHLTTVTGGGARNPFGLAFFAAGKQWTTSLCQDDSDDDGMTNGYELGDPCCEWTQQGSAGTWRGERTTALTQPGIKNTGSDVTTAHGCPAGSGTTTAAGTQSGGSGGTTAGGATTPAASGGGGSVAATTASPGNDASVAGRVRVFFPVLVSVVGYVALR